MVWYGGVGRRGGRERLHWVELGVSWVWGACVRELWNDKFLHA